ncbi:hypothetical protein NIES970_21800 [[Synechococcus] sp. NIES-970]|nr:hypothetical protein NIES970_21800 [[Synechococcus] sp. NIES-970]
MKINGFVLGLICLGGSLVGNQAIAQSNMKNGFLNIQMRTALCGQNWPQAIQVLDTMKQISPKDRPALDQYRALLVRFRNNNARLPAWPPAEYCSGALNTLPSPNMNGATPNSSPAAAPGTAAPRPTTPTTPEGRIDTIPVFN